MSRKFIFLLILLVFFIFCKNVQSNCSIEIYPDGVLRGSTCNEEWITIAEGGSVSNSTCGDHYKKLGGLLSDGSIMVCVDFNQSMGPFISQIAPRFFGTVFGGGWECTTPGAKISIYDQIDQEWDLIGGMPGWCCGCDECNDASWHNVPALNISSRYKDSSNEVCFLYETNFFHDNHIFTAVPTLIK